MKRLLVPVLVAVIFLAAGSAAAAEKPIKIGLLAEKTGGLAAYGYSHEKVIQAAVKRVNDAGGIGGRPVELFVEDTESKPPVGALKFRKLVDTVGVDFVLDSNHSGVAIASSAVALELKTPYFPCGSATDISGDKGNRYVFQSCTNVKGESQAAAKWAVKTLGKKWVTVVVNFAWGWANEKDFADSITAEGGQVLDSIRVPLGAGDWLPYLKKIPEEAEAVYFANFGSDFLSFVRDLHAVRPGIKGLGAVYAFSAQDIAKLGEAAEGLYCLTSYPTQLVGLDTPYNAEYRKLIGVDDDGVETGTGKRFVLAYDWCVWEAFHALKAGIEKSGWKSREDNPKLIQTLEGMEFKAGLEFPQGDMFFRPQDHLIQAGLYIEQISGGKLKVVMNLPASELAYPPLVDHTKSSF